MVFDVLFITDFIVGIGMNEIKRNEMGTGAGALLI